jgi:hypothetical protein
MGRRPRRADVDRRNPMTARSLTPEESSRAGAAFERIFARADELQPFRPDVPARLFLWPTEVTELERPQFEALAGASIEAGQPTAYIAAFGQADAGWSGMQWPAVVDLRDYEGYANADAAIVEHALFAAGGEWGVAAAHGSFALVGGRPEVVEAMRARLGYDDDAAVADFIADWWGIENPRQWVPGVLDHVYGPGATARRWPQAYEGIDEIEPHRFTGLESMPPPSRLRRWLGR